MLVWDIYELTTVSWLTLGLGPVQTWFRLSVDFISTWCWTCFWLCSIRIHSSFIVVLWEHWFIRTKSHRFLQTRYFCACVFKKDTYLALPMHECDMQMSNSWDWLAGSILSMYPWLLSSLRPLSMGYEWMKSLTTSNFWILPIHCYDSILFYSYYYTSNIFVHYLWCLVQNTLLYYWAIIWQWRLTSAKAASCRNNLQCWRLHLDVVQPWHDDDRPFDKS